MTTTYQKIDFLSDCVTDKEQQIQESLDKLELLYPQLAKIQEMLRHRTGRSASSLQRQLSAVKTKQLALECKIQSDQIALRRLRSQLAANRIALRLTGS